MLFFSLSFFSYLIDKVFGEFSFIPFYKHPVVFMGKYIKFFEKKFYQNNINCGIFLNISLLLIVFSIIYLIEIYINNFILDIFLGSTTISANMLYERVKNIQYNPKEIQYLVSRDTDKLSLSDTYKASIETYAENLSDGVIAPIFYMLLFGLYGAFLYKAINTLDSMVGYRTKRYEKFGKFSAIVDDIVNFIPSRLTAIIISLLFLSQKALLGFHKFGKLHKSPNAGEPISAMALSLNISLGGDTSYFGKVEKKPYFGNGSKIITISNLKNALKMQIRFDIFILVILQVLTNIH